MSFPSFTVPFDPDNLAIRRCPTSRRRAPRRILIVKFGALGDILMTTPLLTALRRSYPEAHLTWMVERCNAQAIDANPHVDEVIHWDGGHWDFYVHSRPRNWARNLRVLRSLRDAARLGLGLHGRFDTLISFHPERWPLLLVAVAPDVSIGVFQSARDATRDYTVRYTTAYTKEAFPAHQTDTYLLPLEALGLPPAADRRMVMGYTAEDAAVADLWLGERGIGPGFVVLVPGTTWPTKCWPEPRWGRLADALARHGRRVVLMGGTAEGEAVRRVASGMRSACAVLAGDLGFRQAAALVARASLCVSGDTGPMHVAAAVDTPYVSLFGPTLPSRYAPLEGRGLILAHPVPCGPCMKEFCPNPPESQIRCMDLIGVPEVLDACLTAIGGGCLEQSMSGVTR